MKINYLFFITFLLMFSACYAQRIIPFKIEYDSRGYIKPCMSEKIIIDSTYSFINVSSGKVIASFDTSKVGFLECFNNKYYLIKQIRKTDENKHIASPYQVPITDAYIIKLDEPFDVWFFPGNSNTMSSEITGFVETKNVFTLISKSKKILFKRYW